MERYKFRGKKKTGEWFYGFGVKYLDWVNGSPECWLYTHNGIIEVDPATVGQYTGRQDEEKTDIYDGDKLFAKGNLSDELQYIGTVVWDDEDCRFEVVNYLQGGRFEWIPDGCVVRGSIHDPEVG